MNDEHRRTPIIVAGFLICTTLLVGLVFMGGQTSKILSTVGNSIGGAGTTGTNGGGDTSGGATSGNQVGAAPGSGSGGQVADGAAVVPALLIVRTGSIGLEVPDLDRAVTDAESAVLRAGGYVSGSQRSASTGDASARETFRIPSAVWSPTLVTLRGLANRILDEQIKTDEVTAQVVDLRARIGNLRATEAALQVIMAKATKISDVLEVQTQLTSTRGDIERLSADQKTLEDRASFGSLDVQFSLPVAPRPTPTPKPVVGWDPGADVARASDRLVRIGQTTTSIGIWLAIIGLPVLVTASIGLVVAWQLYRLTRWVLRRRGLLLPGA